MAFDAVPAAAPPAAPAPTSTHELGSSDERWAAWHAKGVIHDRAVRRRMAIAAPIAVVVAAAVVYALLGG